MIGKSKNEIIIYVVVILILFITGVVSGYFIWGVEQAKGPDFKKALEETIAYISSLEEKNEALKKEMNALRSDLRELAVKQEEPEKLKATINALQEKVTSLDKENKKFVALIEESKEGIQNRKELENQVQESHDTIETLKNEKADLYSEVQEYRNVTKELEEAKLTIQSLNQELDALKAGGATKKEVMPPELIRKESKELN